MNEPGVTPPHGPTRQPRDARGEAARQPAQPSRRQIFESLLQRQAADGAGEAEGEPALDGAAFRFDGPAHPAADGLQPSGEAVLPAPVPLFASTLGTQAAPPVSAARTGFVPLLGNLGGRSSRTGPGALLAADAPPPSPDAEMREATWELVREVTESLHVAPQRQAGHGAVHLALKGRLLAGTEITLVRQGQRLDVSIVAGSPDGRRLLQQQVEALQEVLSQGLPDCHVSISLTHKA